jgi:hypothetical protein
MDDVAGEQFVVLRQMRHLLGDVPDHVGEVARLFGLAVDFQPDRTLGHVADLRPRVEVTDHRRMIERLADMSRLLLVAHRLLQIAIDRIDTAGIPTIV